MSLPHGLLGLLASSSSTGYELTKRFESSLNYFWHAQSSQIYRELNRLEEKGLVTSETVIQEGRPNKRVYSITESGLNAFLEWMNTPASFAVNAHDPLLMYTFFGASAPEMTLHRFKAVRDSITANLETRTQQIQETIDNYKKIIPDGETKSVYWEMTKDYGIAHAKFLLEWAKECIAKLEGEAEC